MSNEIQTTTKAPMMVGRMGVEMKTMEEVYRFATLVCKSDFAPKGATPESMTIAIQKGFECGIPPLVAIQNIAVINGRPTIYGDIGLAMVRGSGLLEYIQETQTDDARNMLATCKIKRKGQPESIYTFSQNDATLAGLWGKQGPWKQYPKRMLMWRARWFALRDQFGDILAGLQGREEYEGVTVEVEAEVTDTEIKKPKRKPTIDEVRAAAKPAPEPDPVPQDAPTDDLFPGREPGEDD